jgi:hypothetical protein
VIILSVLFTLCHYGCSLSNHSICSSYFLIPLSVLLALCDHSVCSDHNLSFCLFLLLFDHPVRSYLSLVVEAPLLFASVRLFSLSLIIQERLFSSFSVGCSPPSYPSSSHHFLIDYPICSVLSKVILYALSLSGHPICSASSF